MRTKRSEIQERLDRLFGRVERMTDAELVLLRTVWDEQDPAAREQAWQTVRAIVRLRQRQGLLDDARSRVASWINNYPAAMAGDYGYFLVSGSGMDPGAIRQAAIPPMMDAIAAIIAADGLDAHEQTLLLEPVTTLAPHTITA